MINIGDFIQPIMASLAFSVSMGFPKLVGTNKQNFDIVKFAQPFVIGILLGVIAGIQNVPVTQDWINTQTAVYFIIIALIMFLVKIVWRTIGEWIYLKFKTAQTALGVTDAQIDKAEEIIDEIATPVEQAILSEQEGDKALKAGKDAVGPAITDAITKEIFK